MTCLVLPFLSVSIVIRPKISNNRGAQQFALPQSETYPTNLMDHPPMTQIALPDRLLTVAVPTEM
jgi:hypothetical protein